MEARGIAHKTTAKPKCSLFSCFFPWRRRKQVRSDSPPLVVSTEEDVCLQTLKTPSYKNVESDTNICFISLPSLAAASSGDLTEDKGYESTVDRTGPHSDTDEVLRTIFNEDILDMVCLKMSLENLKEELYREIDSCSFDDVDISNFCPDATRSDHEVTDEDIDAWSALFYYTEKFFPILSTGQPDNAWYNHYRLEASDDDDSDNTEETPEKTHNTSMLFKCFGSLCS